MPSSTLVNKLFLLVFKPINTKCLTSTFEALSTSNEHKTKHTLHILAAKDSCSSDVTNTSISLIITLLNILLIKNYFAVVCNRECATCLRLCLKAR